MMDTDQHRTNLRTSGFNQSRSRVIVSSAGDSSGISTSDRTGARHQSRPAFSKFR